MKITRRTFVRDGVAAFTVGVVAPTFLSDLARAQGAVSRNLVVLYLGGGNDALSTLIPYTDPFYYSRRPSVAIPAAQVLQIGADSSGKPLGLHPQLTGLRTVYDRGHLALIQRAGYENSSRSHFTGVDIWATGDPRTTQGTGWLGRYLDALPSPVDPLVAWPVVGEVPHALFSRTVPVPAIPSTTGYAFASPNSGTEAQLERTIATRIASHVPVDRPHVSFVNATAQAALVTLDRVASVTSYQPTLTYPNTGLGQALRTVAGVMVRGIGTKVFWVQTGGYDTHASQGGAGGSYPNLMTQLGGGLLAFYTDLNNRGLLNDTLVIVFSEFGRRISENGSTGTDHGAGGLMMVMGGSVNGGLHGTAASLNPIASNPTLENSANDVRYETDFRSVYAAIFDRWLGANSLSLLGGDFRSTSLRFI